MLKRLKGVFYSNQIEKNFEDARINNSHQLVYTSYLNNLIPNIKNQKTKKQIISTLQKKINSKNYTVKLKGFIALHFFIRKSSDQDFMSIIYQCQKLNTQTMYTLSNSTDEQLKQYIQSHIILPYQKYLKKFTANFESYQFAKEYNEFYKVDPMIVTSHCFHVLNLINMVLQTQQSFSKMGRYYSNHNEIISLLHSYLQDITVFNSFIKTAVHVFLKDFQCYSNQQLKHCFLFITQAQKTSDRLYQFYHNRYFYQTMKKSTFYPAFLTVPPQAYRELKRRVKIIDKNIIGLVMMSTMPSNNLNTSIQTQPSNKILKSIQTSLNNTITQFPQINSYYMAKNNLYSVILN